MVAGGGLFSHFGPNFYVYAPILKFEVLNWLELSQKQIRTSKSVLEYIFWLLLITALVKWVNLS